MNTADLTKCLDTISEEIDLAKAHLADLHLHLTRLDQAGMYPAVPVREAWETKANSSKEYMYHYFGLADDGSAYAGPDGKRKLYIGNDPDRVKEARRLATNREEYERTQAIIWDLEHWLRRFGVDLNRLAADAGHWPRHRYQYNLGPLDAAGVAPG